MKNYNYILFGFLLTCIIFSGCNPSERFDYVKVHFENEDIYIKKINWGITGDAQKTAISTSKRKDFENEEMDYTDNSMTEFFYKTSGDTLLLFVRQKLSSPKNWDSKIIVKQIVLDNPRFMNLYDEQRDCIDDKDCIRSF